MAIAVITRRLTILAARPGSMEHMVPENRLNRIEKKGKLQTKSIYLPSFFNCAAISSKSSV
jgi:hypothetical protein